MDFSLTGAQQEAARLAARVLDDDTADPWKELARAGLLALALPAELGGDELGVMGTAAVATEVGRRAVPVPALATLMTGILPIARWGDETLRRALLPPAAAGDLVLTAAVREPSEPLPLAPRTTATTSTTGTAGTAGTAGTVSGVKVGVPYAAQARHVLVPVSFTSAHGPETETGVVIIDPAAPGAHLTPTRSSSGAPECTLVLDRAPVEHVLGHAGCLADLSGLAIAGACALADGALAAALDLTTDHVAERRQFGRPLAAFQSVAQQIADVYIASRTLHLATQAACWQLDAGAGRDAPDDISVAGYWCAREAPAAVRTCHHLHGGLGMDVSYPLYRFSALIGDLVRALGGADYQLERLPC